MKKIILVALLFFLSSGCAQKALVSVDYKEIKDLMKNGAILQESQKNS